MKWLGGKRKLISQIEPFLPNKIERYFEPFLGGGSMFFYIKQKYHPKYAMISDVNEDLISTYKAVRDNPEELIKNLRYFERENSKAFFYKVRKNFNDKKILGIRRSAAFIYLNKTCFNGVYRVNKKNEFNVPYGRYKNREIYNSEDIFFASELLQGVVIKTQDYRGVLKYLKRGDVIYLDPCYDPLKKTSFSQYTPNRFSLEDRRKLYEFMLNARSKGATLRLSNNKLNDIWKLYESAGFQIHVVKTCRTVNSNILDRGEISELIICN